ncbi:MAG TPA: P-II family nitrogen regulator [Terriglobia bacterium]|nr:P-II family nitrogen regulator [Terriglobia bacterium]
MKLVQCILRPEKLEEVIDALERFTEGVTVCEVRGHGRQRGHKIVYRGREYRTGLLPKVMIEVVSDESWVDDVIKVVVETARTGEIGDGRIFILPVDESYQVRTGFMDI